MIRKTLAIALSIGGAVACGDSTGPRGPTSTLTVNLCSSFGKGWFAYQNTGDEWIALTPGATGQVTFNATERVSVAMSRTISGSSYTRVLNVTSAELRAALGTPCVSDNGTNFITGVVGGVTGTQYARISAGPATDVADPLDPALRLVQLTSAPVDIIATRYPTSTGQPANRVLVRRGVLPPNSAIADLDFGNSTESALPQTETVTFTGAGANATIFLSTSVRSASGTNHTLGELSASTGTTAFAYVSLPAPLRLPTDQHVLSALAFNSEGIRSISRTYLAPNTLSLAFGPMVQQPTLTLVATSPYVRPRAEVAAQAEYPTAVQMDFSETVNETSNRQVSVLTTAGFLGATPQTWDVAFPDLRAAGFPIAAGLHSTTYFFAVSVYGGDIVSQLGGSPSVGSTLITTTRSGQATTGATTANRSP